VKQLKIILQAILIAVTFGAVSPAFADATRLSAADFLEMNETYRAAMIHGLLASLAVLGVPKEYQSIYDEGINCRAKQRPMQTTYRLSSDFARYLNEHPDEVVGEFPIVFLIFMAHCPE
jgi:hypothetical protein